MVLDGLPRSGLATHRAAPQRELVLLQ